MVWKGQLKGGQKIKGNQENVMNAFFTKGPYKPKKTESRVCVSASAGTGKTTLLVEIVAESALREWNNGNKNPFGNILAVSFNIEAARQIKNKVRKKLREHFQKDNTRFPEKLLTGLENQSWIMTLDSFTRRLLNEVAIDAGITPSPEVPEEYDLEQVKNKIFDEISNIRALQPHIRQLERFSPVEEWRGNQGWKSVISQCLNDARVYCLSANELEKNVKNTYYNDIYKSKKPKFNQKDVNTIVRDLWDNGSQPPVPTHLDTSFKENEEMLSSFFMILEEYEKRYDQYCRSQGIMGHDDARYHIVQFAKAKSIIADEWRKSQLTRFRYVLVDEFQDTSYVQCELIRHFIGKVTKLMVIGDPKQSIYKWRNASPEILIDIISKARNYPKYVNIPDSYLKLNNWTKVDLTQNYRSHKDLIKLFNDLFGSNLNSIFKDSSLTLNTPLPHPNLKPYPKLTKTPQKNPNEKRLHVLNGTNDHVQIVNYLKDIKDEKIKLTIYKDDKWVNAKIGDCAILMQSKSRTSWPRLRTELNDGDINYYLLAEKGLFSRPEISLLIDILDWLANPYNKDSIIRILRSPILGLDDTVLRYLASHDFRLKEALEDKNKPSIFKKKSIDMINGLIALRDDLRWTREGKKNSMIDIILNYSKLDITLLTLKEGKQCLANIYYFQDILAQWEAEELLSYQNLVERLKWYRENGEEAYNQAVMADEKDESAVKIATVHATKGLEFPVVFIYRARTGFNNIWKSFNRTPDPYKMRDRGKTFFLRQLSSNNNPRESWEDRIRPQPEGISSVIARRNDKCLFDEFVYDYYEEKWRLFYVAMTRAKYHLFINHGMTQQGKEIKEPSWGREFGKRYKNSNSIPRQLSGDPMPGQAKKQHKPKALSFDLKNYQKIKKNLEYFVPETLNPTHIYDILYCPRRYQYSVLQEAGSGDICEYRKSNYEKVKFGINVHRALELINFKKPNNPEYIKYIDELKRRDYPEYQDVNDAVKELLNSNIFKQLGLDKNDTLKEYEVTYYSHTKPEILFKDKIDLLVKTPEGLQIIDYKTSEEKGNVEQLEHRKYQLAAYADALLNYLGQKVVMTSLLIYDKQKNKWKKMDFSPKNQLPDITKELQKKLTNKIKIVPGGLERNQKYPKCTKGCGYESLCKK